MNRKLGFPPDDVDCEPFVGRTSTFSIPLKALTWNGFRTWATSEEFPENARIDFLGTEIYIDMSGEQVDTHALLKMAVSRVVDGFVLQTDLGMFFPDGCRLSNEEAEISNDPDGLFATWETLESNRLRRNPKASGEGIVELEGTPDMAMEIVSDSSIQKDTTLLMTRYHRARIREYWLIDARGDEILFQILRYEPDGYVAVTPSRGGWVRSEVFGASSAWSGSAIASAFGSIPSASAANCRLRLSKWKSSCH